MLICPADSTEARSPPIDLAFALTAVDGERGLLTSRWAGYCGTTRRVGELRQAVAAGNAHLIERLARRLEGGCQAVGAEAAGRLAQAVESAGRLRGPDAAGAAVEALTRELDRLARFVAKPDWMEAAR